MDETSPSLTDFLRARLDEDDRYCSMGTDPESWCDRANGTHYEAPRVLAEIAAKEGIIDLHQEQFPDGDPYQKCLVDGDDYPCATLRLLALPYADHAYYRDEWKPS